MAAKKPSKKGSEESDGEGEVWELRLYVAGPSPRASLALRNLKQICQEYLEGKCHLEVVDLLKNPRLARDDQIVAIPTLIKRLPPPMRTIIGDLSNTERVLVGLDIKPTRMPPGRAKRRQARPA